MRFWKNRAIAAAEAPRAEPDAHALRIVGSYWDKDNPDWVGAPPSTTHRCEKAMYCHLVKDFPGKIDWIVDA